MVEIAVEVVYALPKKQTITRLHVAENTTVLDAIHQSGILEQYPNIDLKHNKVGVFGKICALQDKLNDGDRVRNLSRVAH